MRNPFSHDLTDDETARANALRLQPVDQARVAVRPPEVGLTFVEVEYDALADEQAPLWAAEGAEAARAVVVDAAGTGQVAEELLRQLDGQQALVAGTRERYQSCLSLLGPYRRREPGAKKWYLARWGFLLGGDVAGQAGAALAYGEPYVTALPQALATGMAALTAGMVGADIRDWRQAIRRQRDADDLPDELTPWVHLFTGPDPGLKVVRTVAGVAATAGLLVAGGIFALRAAIDGTGAGLVFGLLAAAITIASFVNSYFYADEIADQIDGAEHDYATEAARAQMLARHELLVDYQRASAETDSITTEHADRGAAATRHYEALKWRALRGNPGVVGHGFAPDEPEPIGRRLRQESGS